MKELIEELRNGCVYYEKADNCKSATGIINEICTDELMSKAANVLEQLKKNLDEADRRAGEAERKLEYANDTINLQRSATRKMKLQAGFDDSVSFDTVWNQVIERWQSPPNPPES